MDYSVCLVYYNNIVLSKMKIFEACLLYRNGNYFVVGWNKYYSGQDYTEKSPSKGGSVLLLNKEGITTQYS